MFLYLTKLTRLKMFSNFDALASVHLWAPCVIIIYNAEGNESGYRDQKSASTCKLLNMVMKSPGRGTHAPRNSELCLNSHNITVCFLFFGVPF